MADKQVKSTKTIPTNAPVKTAVKAKPAAAPAIAEKPAASRVKSVKHSTPAKTRTVEVPLQAPVDVQAEISRLAYSYWVARGYQGGSQAEDWFRAEAEFRQRVA